MKQEINAQNKAFQRVFMVLATVAMVLFACMGFSLKALADDFYVDGVVVDGRLQKTYEAGASTSVIRQCAQINPDNFNLTVEILKRDENDLFVSYEGSVLIPGMYRLKISLEILGQGYFDENTICEYNGRTYGKNLLQGQTAFDYAGRTILTFTTPETFEVTVQGLFLDPTDGTLYLSGTIVKEQLQAYAENDEVKKVVALKGTKFPWDSSNLFENFKTATSFDLGLADTSRAYVMESMFSGCESCTSIDLSSFNTSKVQLMDYMFYDCQSVTSLDVSSFDTSEVQSMKGMFWNCYHLTSLDLGGFDTSNVHNMAFMFQECWSIKNLDLSGFDTSNVTNMVQMFLNCNYLESLDVSSFDTSSVTSMFNMFSGCRSLTSLDVSGFDTSNVNSMLQMFLGCYSLKTLDISSFDTSNVRSMSQMFRGCLDLSSLNLGDLNTSNAKSMEYMFENCVKLKSLNLQSFDTSNVTNLRNMFAGCFSLEELSLVNFDTSKVTNVEGLFQNCKKLRTVTVSSDWTMESVTESANMFTGCALLVGGNGTAYNSVFTDKTYARIDKAGQPGYLTQSLNEKPAFTKNLDEAYSAVMGKQWGIMLTVSADNVYDYPNAYRWYIYDGKKDQSYTIEQAVEMGWFKLASDYNVGRSSHQQLVDLSEKMDGKQVYCVASGPGGKTKSNMATIHVEKKLAWFEFEIENFESLENVYKDDQLFGSDVKAWKLKTPEGAHYTGELAVAWLKNGSYPAFPDDMYVYPGQTLRFGIYLTPDDGYSVNGSFDGAINGLTATPVKITGGLTDESDWTYAICIDYEVPIPENGIMVPSFSREITKPVPGEQPATELADQRPGMARNNKYVVTGLSWSPADEVFRNGKQYTLTIDLKARENFGFYEENEFFINGNKMEVLELVKGKEGTAKVSYKFLTGTIPDTEVVITKQPKNWYGEKYGVKASFDVEATGEGLSYQWQYKKGSGDWTDWMVTTGDTANLKVTLNDKTEKYQIRCKITDEYEVTAYTNVVKMMLAEKNPIQIVTQPKNYYNAVIGKKASFDVEATGVNLHYQWQWDKGGTWQNYTGATADTANFKITANETTMKRSFRCEITDDEGNWAYTNAVKIYEEADPGSGGWSGAIPLVITKQPTDWVGEYGKKASFSVEAAGDGDLTYQWQYRKGNTWTNYAIATADTANLKVTMNEKNIKWAFRCVITDSEGKSVTTNEVHLRLKSEEPTPEPEPQPAAGPVITSQPGDCIGRIGKKVTFTVAATGEGLTYEWQVKKATTWSAYALAGYDTPTFQVSVNEKTLKWTYRCVVRDAAGNEVATNEVHIYAEE